MQNPFEHPIEYIGLILVLGTLITFAFVQGRNRNVSYIPVGQMKLLTGLTIQYENGTYVLPVKNRGNNTVSLWCWLQSEPYFLANLTSYEGLENGSILEPLETKMFNVSFTVLGEGIGELYFKVGYVKLEVVG